MKSSAAPGGDPETQDIVAFLEESGVLGPSPVRRIDTHAAQIFLAGDRAWKLKRPVALGYLDFSTAEKRRAALTAELRLNRRTAPALYLGLHAITSDTAGALALDGSGTPVDWLLEMRRFPDDALLKTMAESDLLSEGLMMRLAERIHEFHGDAAVYRAGRGAARLAEVIEGNAARLQGCGDAFAQEAVDTLITRQRQALHRSSELLDKRARAGRIRHCHGDLHLANIAVMDADPVPFDCLEFDPGLATIDVLYDLAFLLMDLWNHELRTEANLVFNRYFDLSAEDEDGVSLLPLLMSLRATVRAHIAATRAMSGDPTALKEARDFLLLAMRLLDPRDALLLAIGGRSGTGKSTLARELGGGIGVAPGARILRSDVLRKRLAGRHPEDRLPTAHYTPDASVRIYRQIEYQASALLKLGCSVVADAAYLKVEERDSIQQVADAAGAAFAGIWLVASMDDRVARVTARVNDASDADVDVVRLQTRRPVGRLAGWRRLSTSRDAAAVLADASELVGRSAPAANS